MSQENTYNEEFSTSGVRIGLNTEVVLMGEFGIYGEYYFNKNSLYLQANFNRQALGSDSKADVAKILTHIIVP